MAIGVRNLVAAAVGAGAAVGVDVLTERTMPARRAQVLGAGWIAHAGFDAVFTPHDASRIPSWYPAMCAGYDVALGARLLS